MRNAYVRKGCAARNARLQAERSLPEYNCGPCIRISNDAEYEACNAAYELNDARSLYWPYLVIVLWQLCRNPCLTAIWKCDAFPHSVDKGPLCLNFVCRKPVPLLRCRSVLFIKVPYPFAVPMCVCSSTTDNMCGQRTYRFSPEQKASTRIYLGFHFPTKYYLQL